MDIAETLHRRRRLLLFLLLLAHFASWAWWMRSNGYFSRPPVEDAAVHRLRALEIIEAAEAGGIAGFVRGVLAHRGPQPPVLASTAAAIGLIHGDLDPFATWLVSGLFAVLLGAGTYRLARNFGRGGFALGVAALTLSAPVVVAMQRPLYPQLPSVAVLVWAWDLLLRTDRFRRWGASVLFGLVGGLAVETKVLVGASVGAPALVLLIAALIPRGGRLRALAGAGLAAVVAAAVIAPWYVPHWPEVLAYANKVTAAEGQAVYSGGVGLWTVERWSYFAVALANNGFTLSIAVLVLAGLVRELVRLVRRDPADPVGVGFVLAAAPLVDYPLLTFGQTSAFSVYVMSFVPLGMIVACRFAASRASEFGRRCAVLWLCASSCWCLYLVNRPFDQDAVSKAVVGPFEFVPRVDYNFAQFAAMAGAVPGPAGEVWPVREYVDLMLAKAPRARPRATSIPSDTGGHLYMFRQNFEYEARVRGRGLEWISLTKFWNAKDVVRGADAAAGVDFAVVDEAKVRLETVRELFTMRGVETEILDRRTVTPTSTITLLAVRRPWERPARVSERVLGEAGVVRAEARFANGWKMVGYERTADPFGNLFLNTFWSLDPAGPDGFDWEGSAVVGKSWTDTTSQPAEPIARSTAGGTSAVAERELLVFSIGAPKGVDPATIAHTLGMRERGSKGSSGFSAVVTTDLAKNGSNRVRIDVGGPPPKPETRAGGRPATRPASGPAGRTPSRPVTRPAAPTASRPSSRPGSR